MSRPFRLGLVGMDGSHADVFLGAFNSTDRFPGLRVDCLSDGDEARMAELSSRHDVPNIHPCYTSMEGLVDGVIIAHRDARLHEAPARHFLSRGIPCFVDKPMASNAEVAQELMLLANASGTRVTSLSVIPLQQSNRVALAQARDGEKGRLLGISGTCDPECEWNGLRFYGVHHVEVLRAYWDEMPDSVVYKGVIGGHRLFEFHWEVKGEYCMLRGCREFGGPFTLHFEKGNTPITLDEDPYRVGLEQIADFFLRKRLPRSHDTLFEVHQLLDAMQAAWLCQGSHILV
ncbi:MAG: Gfo/Idh/MocA family oxidoreductase [Candidatus Sumerlaeia bacterium]|nr:Gfo/Idh/MocA family oxidoreductase [Candidatus Sumerlaeia bacterium]